MTRIALCGGTYAGKSTMLKMFEEKGFKAVKEASLVVINNLIQDMEVEEQKNWRRNNNYEFYSRATEMYKKLEAKVENPTDKIVFDRSVFDYVALCKLRGVDVPENLNRLSTIHKKGQSKSYDKVFLLDTLDSFDPRPESGRTLLRDGSLRLRDMVKEELVNAGYNPIFVKDMKREERFNFICSYLQTPL